MKLMTYLGIVLLFIVANGHFSSPCVADEQKQAYDKMVEEATREADDYIEQKQREQRQAADAVQTRQSADLDTRVQAERDRIEGEMDTVRERGLGPNYTEGMRENQLRLLQEKLDQLISDPEAYFEGQ